MKLMYRGALATLAALLLAGALAGSAMAEESWEKVQISPGTARFEGTANGVSFKNASGIWTCEKAEIQGGFTNGKEVTASEKYKGCTTDEGVSKKEFTTASLKGKLGLALVAEEPALKLEPVEGTTWVTQFYGLAPITGKIMGMLSPMGKKTSELTLKYAVSSGHQHPSEFFYNPPEDDQLELLEKPLLDESTFKLTMSTPVTIERT